MIHVRRIGIAVAIGVAVTGALIASRRSETLYSISPPPAPPREASVDAVGPLTAESLAPVPASSLPLVVAGPPVAIPTEPTPTTDSRDDLPDAAGDDSAAGSDGGRGKDEGADSRSSADGKGAPAKNGQSKSKNQNKNASLSRAEKKMLDLINAEREEAGCGPVRADRALSRAAQQHSTDMAEHDYFSTIAPDGRGPAERARAAGYTGATSENVAKDAADAGNALSSWLKTGSAQSNIVACSTSAVGVGLARAKSGMSFWTVDFGAA